MAKEGSTLSGLMEAFATCVSVALQYGVPLETLCSKFKYMRFKPSGYTSNRDIPMAASIPDYLFRYPSQTFIEENEGGDHQWWKEVHRAWQRGEDKEYGYEDMYESYSEDSKINLVVQEYRISMSQPIQADAPICAECGAITVRSGACYVCTQCGSSSG